MDAAAVAGAGALQQFRQQREDRRRVALGGRRLADGQPDLALRHGEAGHRVHHQVDPAALVAEVLGDGRGEEAPAGADQRQPVGGGHHHHRAPEPFRAQVLLEELAHLAAALADQGDDVDVGGGRAGDHAEQHALAHARAREDADALPAAAPSAARRWRGCRDRAARECGGGAWGSTVGAYSGYSAVADTGPLPSIGTPSPSITRPSSSGPTRTVARCCRATTRQPGPMPRMSSSGISSTWRSRNPKASAASGGRLHA